MKIIQKVDDKNSKTKERKSKIRKRSKKIQKGETEEESLRETMKDRKVYIRRKYERKSRKQEMQSQKN